MSDMLLAELLRLKALAYDTYIGLNAIEQTMLEIETLPKNDEPKLMMARTPLMFDGNFEVNNPGEESIVLTFNNKSNDTLHFTPEFSEPYVFGRLHDINGKRIEGILKVVLKNIDERPFVALSTSTEKINFAHPTKEHGRVRLEQPHGMPLMPGGVLEIMLYTNSILDTANSKLTFEDLTLITGGINDVE